MHTWPEQGTLMLGVYVSNSSADDSAGAHALMHALPTLFDATHVTRHALQRGKVSAMPSERDTA